MAKLCTIESSERTSPGPPRPKYICNIVVWKSEWILSKKYQPESKCICCIMKNYTVIKTWGWAIYTAYAATPRSRNTFEFQVLLLHKALSVIDSDSSDGSWQNQWRIFWKRISHSKMERTFVIHRKGLSSTWIGVWKLMSSLDNFERLRFYWRQWLSM